MNKTFFHDENQKEYIEPESIIHSEPNHNLDERYVKLINDMQREINLLTDRVIVLERLGAVNMFPRKFCGYCSGTGKVFYGTVCEPPVGDCYICNGKGFI